MTGNFTIFFYLFIMILAIVAIFSIYAFQSRRAIYKVLEIFCRHKALGIGEAKSLIDLGLERPDFVQRMMRPRDYKQYALQVLIKQGIISVTGEGKLYLEEDRLDQRVKCKVKELQIRGGSSMSARQ